MQFDFATANRIVFGPGSAAAIPSLTERFGKRVLLVTGRNRERASWLRSSIDAVDFVVDGEPTVNRVQEGVAVFREAGCDLAIAFGGGSVIDGAKAIAALAANPGDALDYLEVVGRGGAIPNPPFPFIAVPTTAGTGSEVTRNAVLGSPEHGVKASLRSPLMLPRIAVVDPELTFDLPPAITASTGMDALTQLIEPYVSSRANAMVDMFCVEGIRRVASSLRTAYRDGRNCEARTGMSYAALLGGLSLANAGLGIVHGFAAPIGGMFEAPHGAVCAALLPSGMQANIAALRSRAPAHEALLRYQRMAAILTGDEHARPEHGVAWVRELCLELGIPGLRTYGIAEAHVPDIAEKAAKASSTKANALQLTAAEMTGILRGAL